MQVSVNKVVVVVVICRPSTAAASMGQGQGQGRGIHTPAGVSLSARGRRLPTRSSYISLFAVSRCAAEMDGLGATHLGEGGREGGREGMMDDPRLAGCPLAGRSMSPAVPAPSSSSSSSSSSSNSSSMEREPGLGTLVNVPGPSAPIVGAWSATPGERISGASVQPAWDPMKANTHSWTKS
ncbi:hypothetical protein LIA77_05600 [Sarocladium implicatum]|nr:hypothetical protein LIA77_05600 [Sarocladium implicatum]